MILSQDTLYSIQTHALLKTPFTVWSVLTLMIVQDTFPFLMWEISRYLLCRNLSVLIVLCNSIECDGQHALVCKNQMFLWCILLWMTCFFVAGRTSVCLWFPSAPTVMVDSLSPTSITLTWTQPVDDIVSSYEIVFSYQGPCSGFTHTNTTTVEGTSWNYTLTALQEFSNYTVNVTAVNDVGNATATVLGTTLSAGNQ